MKTINLPTEEYSRPIKWSWMNSEFDVSENNPLLQIFGIKEDDKNLYRNNDISGKSHLQLNALINQLVDISKIESGSLSLDLKENELMKFINEIILVNKLKTLEKNISINLVSQIEDIICSFDREKLFDVLCFLIELLIKGQKENGKLIFILKRYPQMPQTSEDYFEIKILSHPDEDFNNLLDYTLKDVRNEMYQSATIVSRIGLYWARKIIELHGGRIQCSFPMNKSKSFTIFVPLNCKNSRSKSNCIKRLQYSVFERRAKLSEMTTQGRSNNPVRTKILTPSEEKILSQVMLVCENYYTDCQFTVKKLSRELGMSHSSLYRKFRKITGISGNKFIRSFRLKKAANMLLKADETISDVTYAVGFEDVKYFRKCFKEEFGMPPRDYQRTHNSLIFG